MYKRQVIARLAFVWQFRTVYLESPISIFDLRDGGWSSTAGLAGTWLFALSRQARLPALKAPVLYALLTGTAVWFSGSVALAVRTDTGQTLPAISLDTLQGTTVRLSDYSGRPTVVNLWATWCAPCVREMPLLQQAQAGNPSVHFVFVNQGESGERVRGWLETQKLPLRNVLLDTTGKVGAKFDQKGLPATLFFDGQARLVTIRVGELSSLELSQKLGMIAD